MRIKGRSEVEQDAALINRLNKPVTDGSSAKTGAAKAPAGGGVGESDKVDLGIAKYISQELNAADIEKKRRERVEELKRLVQSGEYNPKSEDVAQAVGEEIVMEILTAGAANSTR